MRIKVRDNTRIITKDNNGEDTGWLVPIFNVHDDFLHPDQYPEQVYLTVIGVRNVKGPHLHKKRWGLFTCIRGNAKIVVRTGSGYEEYYTGEEYNFRTIQVPAGTPAALQNIGDEEAFVLNMPAPSWHIDDQDDHPVSYDDYIFKWDE